MSHIAVYTTLDNGWIFASSQPESSIMTNASEIRDMLVAAMIATIISIIFFVIFIVRRYYKSVAKTAEQNEIIVINQSRQAKLGEMMGSISHQDVYKRQVLGSLAEVFPGIPAGMETISCLIALAAGTGIILFISRKF